MTDTLPLRRLGHTGLMFSPLGLGTWQFSDTGKPSGGTWTNVTPKDVRDIMTASFQGGMNWIDTAEMYGHGTSEKAIARALAAMVDDDSVPHDLFIADKWWPVFQFASSMDEHVARQIRDLNVMAIDLYQIHQPYSFSTIKAQANALASLYENDLISAAGVSNFSAKSMAKMDDYLRANGMRLASNQVKYNLLDRSIEYNGILQEAKDRGISIIAYSPLHQGVLTGRFHEDPTSLDTISRLRKYFSHITRQSLVETEPVINALKEIAPKYEKSPAQIALNWVITAHGDNVFAIPGATKPSQAFSNVEAMTFTLNEVDIEHLNDVTKLKK